MRLPTERLPVHVDGFPDATVSVEMEADKGYSEDDHYVVPIRATAIVLRLPLST